MKSTHTLMAAVAISMFSSTIGAASKADYEKAIATAQTAQKAAATVKSEWRDTGKLLKQAAKMAEKGNYAEAIKLAETAEAQGKNGEQQAKSQLNVGNPAYLYH